MTFTAVIHGTPITATQFTELLQAINAVRAASGWTAVTWNNILAEDQPLPAPNVGIMASHLLALRGRMSEALEALGVPAPGVHGSLSDAADDCGKQHHGTPDEGTVTKSRRCAMVLTAVMGWTTGMFAADPPAPPPGMGRYILVLREPGSRGPGKPIKEPDVAKLGGRWCRSTRTES